MDPLDVFLQAALVLGPVRTVRAAFLRVLAALDPQMVLHVPEPTVALIALGTPKPAWPPVEATAGLRRDLEERVQDRRDLVLGHRSLLVIVTEPRRTWKEKKNKVHSLKGDFCVGADSVSEWTRRMWPYGHANWLKKLGF